MLSIEVRGRGPGKKVKCRQIRLFMLFFFLSEKFRIFISSLSERSYVNGKVTFHVHSLKFTIYKMIFTRPWSFTGRSYISSFCAEWPKARLLCFETASRSFVRPMTFHGSTVRNKVSRENIFIPPYRKRFAKNPKDFCAVGRRNRIRWLGKFVFNVSVLGEKNNRFHRSGKIYYPFDEFTRP